MTFSREAQLRRLIGDLADAQIGATFNQYRESDGDDAGPDSPGIRRANLLAYLSARSDAPVLLVAEAAGWRGARYSGLCLFCERQFSDAEPELRRSSRHPHGWSEPSATVVQAAIAPWRDSVVLWNLVPTHPRLRRLMDVLQPRHIGAIGGHAARALGPDVPAVRHPSHGGAVTATRGLEALLRRWLG